MKNIHVLPTHKPSRLHFDGKLFLSPNYQDSKTINSIVEGRNIYITSDEEIKEGDWLFANQGVNKIVEIKEGNYPYGSINNKGDKIFNSKHWKSKIILTTDQDLIASGVQAIDDSFLEWFVKNPTREFVMTLPDVRGLRDIFQPTEKDLYKIIIPQEESKQERMYSEGEVLQMYKDYEAYVIKTPISETLQFSKWFEQLKKK
jgi:hypothetical protein